MAMDREMSRPAALTEGLALMLLARDGIAAIWQLNKVAAEAHRTGDPLAAASMMEIIAEAAEEAWLRAEGERALV
jgi:hypothetical protein